MERQLDPVFVAVRDAVESGIARIGFSLASEAHHPDSFGSLESLGDGDIRGMELVARLSTALSSIRERAV